VLQDHFQPQQLQQQCWNLMMILVQLSEVGYSFLYELHSVHMVMVLRQMQGEILENLQQVQ
jgi:hypothetical protein